MRTVAGLAIVPLVLALAACGSKDSIEAKNESVESVAKKVADSDLKPSPGRWESTMKIEKLDMPGMPPQMAAQMQQAMGREQVFSTCLTPEQASKPNGEFFQKAASGCTYQNFSMAGGHIEGTMTCKGQEGGITVTMKGDYAPDSYTMHTTSKIERGAAGAMTTSAVITSKRVGECTGKEGG